MRILDLCAGTGAFTHIFHKYGDRFRTIMANDFAKESEQIYKLNHPDIPFILEDIHKVDDIPEHDIMIAGFSCQPFSICGYRKGFEDERSNVFWKIIQIMADKRPQIVIFENVKNLITHDSGNTFTRIKQSIEEHNYHIKYVLLDTAIHTKIPQHRERVYILCFQNKDLADRINLNFEPVRTRKIKRYLEDDIDDTYYYNERFKSFNTIQEGVLNENTLYQFRRHYIRENKSNLCPTLTANMGGGGHNVPLLKDDKGIRKLTPRECFNLQGFPRDYLLPDIADSKLYKLAGNAVSPPIVKLIVDRLIQAIDDIVEN